ncbi:MAG: hypothetical protein Q9170_008274, partial [Blastenia crenularia]
REMEAPSPKRRKTSSVTTTPARTKKGSVNATSSTTKWPSYLAPTKASLARSYPHLLNRSLKPSNDRSPLNRSSPQLMPGTEYVTRPITPHGRVDGATVTDGNGDIMARADKNPARTARHRSVNKGALAPAKIGSKSADEDDELSRDLRASPREVAQTANQLLSATEAKPHIGARGFVAKKDRVRHDQAVKVPSTPSRHEPEYAEVGEPRLPSTPTQLGLEPPPRPPSGLLSRSSSSRKSKDRQRSGQKTSPLKPYYRRPRSLEKSSPPKSYYMRPKDLVVGQCPATTDGEAIDWDSGIRTVKLALLNNQLLTIRLRLKYEDLGEKLSQITVCEMNDWAEGELRGYLEELAVKKDLDRIREAVAQYWELSQERAQCWARCERDLQDSISSSQASQGVSSSRKGSESLQGLDLDLPIRFYGRQNIFLSHDGVTLVVRWKIMPSPTGQMERRLSADILLDNEGGDPRKSIDSIEANAILHTLVDNGESVQEAITILAQSIFDNVIATE